MRAPGRRQGQVEGLKATSVRNGRLNDGFPNRDAKPRNGPRGRPTDRRVHRREKTSDDRHRGDIHRHFGGSRGFRRHRRHVAIDVRPPTRGAPPRNGPRNRHTSRYRHGRNAATRGGRLRSDPRGRRTIRSRHDRIAAIRAETLPSDPRSRRTSRRGFAPGGHRHPGCDSNSADQTRSRHPGPDS